ncbi:15265_t:CDS:2, partial [Acaulospora morrowiae]
QNADITEENTVQSADIAQENTVQSASIDPIINSREPELSTNILTSASDQSETNDVQDTSIIVQDTMAQDASTTTAQDTITQDLTIISTLDALHLDAPIATSTISNLPETVESHLAYEEEPGQTQRFLARIGNNFRWPSSMPERFRRNSFRKIADVEFEFDDEIGFNFIFFYNALDKGEFAGHENEWVTVHNQKVIEYGQEYTDDQLNYILETMPGAIQVPVDQTRLPRSKPAKMVIGQRTNNGADYKIRVRVRRPGENNLIALLPQDFYDTKNKNKKYTCGAWEDGGSTLRLKAGGYGAPAEQIRASESLEVSIGDDNNWTKWVRAKFLLWEERPGDQVEYALVGNDVTDQLAYVHEPGNPLKFLDIVDEARLTTFLNG